MKRPERKQEQECQMNLDSRPVSFLTSGSTLLNLALSQRGLDGGWARGRIGNIVGDGSSGKTLCALELCAHAFYYLPENRSDSYGNFPDVKNVSIVYNNVEGVMDFPIEGMYGQKFNEGVEWMRTGTVQDFGSDFLSRVRRLKSGDFLLYVVDSWDALDSKEELDAFIDSIEKEKNPEGSFDLGKQRYGSKRFFKTLCTEIEGANGGTKKDCTLLIVSQTREKIGVVFGEKKYRGGGAALDFYTHQVAWLAEAGKIVVTREGIKITTGINVKARVKRNKVARPFREAAFPILFDYGIDDITSMLHFLYGPKDKEIKGLFDENFKKYDSAINFISKNKLRRELAKMVEEKWARAEAAAKTERERRFPL